MMALTATKSLLAAKPLIRGQRPALCLYILGEDDDNVEIACWQRSQTSDTKMENNKASVSDETAVSRENAFLRIVFYICEKHCLQPASSAGLFSAAYWQSRRQKSTLFSTPVFKLGQESTSATSYKQYARITHTHVFSTSASRRMPRSRS